MGNEHARKKGRPRAAVLRRCWPTFIFITCSTCGSKRGVRSGRTATLSWCVLQTTSWLDLTAKPDAEQFRAELTERMKKFNLELHPEKTRLLEFGPYAIDQRQWRGEGKPETFNF